MKAVLYARVSSEKQAEKDLSISAQLKALRDYASRNGYEVVRDFVDEAESARTANRPAFQEMIAAARSKVKLFDTVLVWKLSRFARNREDSIIYKSFLRKRGIQVVSINEQIDDSPAGLLLEGVIEVIDEFYSANLSQEARRGLKEVAGRGFFPGGTLPIGYKLIEVLDGNAKRKTLSVDPEHSPIVQSIFEAYLEGHGAKQITEKLNAEGVRTRTGKHWTKASVLYVLRNDVYTGDLVWPDTKRLKPGEEQVVIKNHHQAIVSRASFEKVQSLLEERSFPRTHPRQVASSFLLSGLLHCQRCGKAMVGGTAKSGRYRYYGCYSRSRVANSLCDCKAVACNRLEDAIVDKLQGHVLTDENLTELLRLTNTELATVGASADKEISLLQRQVDAKERKLDKLFDAIEDGHVSTLDLAPRLKRLKTEIDQLKQKISEIEMKRGSSSPQMSLTMAQLKAHVASLRALLLEGEFFEQRRFLKSFVRRIDYDYPQVTMHYTFPVNPKGQEYDEVLAIGKISGVCETHFATG